MEGEERFQAVTQGGDNTSRIGKWVRTKKTKDEIEWRVGETTLFVRRDFGVRHPVHQKVVWHWDVGVSDRYGHSAISRDKYHGREQLLVPRSKYTALLEARKFMERNPIG